MLVAVVALVGFVLLTLLVLLVFVRRVWRQVNSLARAVAKAAEGVADASVALESERAHTPARD